MDAFIQALNALNGILWHEFALYVVLGAGVLFTIWSGFSQYRSITHGVALLRGKYDDKNDPGAINHFQALSTALSGTVGLGNIAGVAGAIALGGPGAVFWMWVVGVFGMAIKLTEVTLAMNDRNTDDPDNPHGGAMYVAQKGFSRWGYARVGGAVGGIFCVTLIISSITGGNMFQAWNVGEITNTYFPSIPPIAAGIIMAAIVAVTIIGGIKRIGAVTGRLVPFMCIIYFLVALYVVIVKADVLPEMFSLILSSAFSPAEASGAFLGGTAGYAFLWGMQRALFSNEAGQGSSPIAHSAAKTDEPAREGIVAGMEPFIDTLVVCTLTALVILASGAYDRPAAAHFDAPPAIVAADQIVFKGGDEPLLGRVIDESPEQVTLVLSNPLITEDPIQTIRRDRIAEIKKADGAWLPATIGVPAKSAKEAKISHQWRESDGVFLTVKGAPDSNTGNDLHMITGKLLDGPRGELLIAWNAVSSDEPLVAAGTGLHMNLPGSALTGYAFDLIKPGLGMWIVTLACWLFAISTIISWSYYGEQGTIFLLGERAVLPYKLLYCLLIVVSTLGFIKTDLHLGLVTGLGTGLMLFANIPIMLIFGYQAMRTYRDYIRRLRNGELEPPHEARPLTDLVKEEDDED